MWPLSTQAHLDNYIAILREDGYPYLGSDDSTWTLLDNGDLEWRASDPYDDDADDWTSVQTQEELAESVFCWRNDC